MKAINPMKLITIICTVTCVVLAFFQFQISAAYEPIAKKVGIFDNQSRQVSIVYLDMEEQSAIMRSSNFLLTERSKGFNNRPDKVIYIDPVGTREVISER